MTIRPLDDPRHPVGNMVNPNAKHKYGWQHLGQVLKNLQERTLPARKLTLEPEYDYEPGNIDQL